MSGLLKISSALKHPSAEGRKPTQRYWVCKEIHSRMLTTPSSAQLTSLSQTVRPEVLGFKENNYFSTVLISVVLFTLEKWQNQCTCVAVHLTGLSRLLGSELGGLTVLDKVNSEEGSEERGWDLPPWECFCDSSQTGTNKINSIPVEVLILMLVDS